MAKALLVIDMQEFSLGENHAKVFRYEQDLIDKVNQVIEAYQGEFVIYIRNIMKRNIINKFAPFQAYEGTKEIELVNGLHIVSDLCFDKYEADAFSNSSLVKFCQDNHIEEIEVIGVDGGGCVALTALGACKLGYKVLVNMHAIGTVFSGKQKKFHERLRRKGATILS